MLGTYQRVVVVHLHICSVCFSAPAMDVSGCVCVCGLDCVQYVSLAVLVSLQPAILGAF